MALNFILKNAAFSQNSVIIDFLKSENVPNDSLKMFDFGQHLPLIYKTRGVEVGKAITLFSINHPQKQTSQGQNVIPLSLINRFMPLHFEVNLCQIVMK